jgi:hypothetical protein
MGWKASNAAFARHGLTWDDLEEQQTGEFHGRIFVTGGEVYWSHQVYGGMWVGMKIEEWDEGAHVKNDEMMGGWLGMRDGRVMWLWMKGSSRMVWWVRQAGTSDTVSC